MYYNGQNLFYIIVLHEQYQILEEDGDEISNTLKELAQECENLSNKLINFYFSQLRQTSFLLDEHANNAIEPHRAILSAIRKGDGKLAAQESMKHMQQSLSDICGC